MTSNHKTLKKQDRSSSIGRPIGMLHRLWQVYMDRALAPLGIGSGQIPILMFLLRNDGVNQVDIVRHLRADKSSIARTIRRLVEEDYIKRRPCTEDARAYRIVVTAKGRAIEGRVHAVLDSWSEAVTQDLAAGERELLVRMLEAMILQAHDLVRCRPEDDCADEEVEA